MAMPNAKKFVNDGMLVALPNLMHLICHQRILEAPCPAKTPPPKHPSSTTTMRTDSSFNGTEQPCVRKVCGHRQFLNPDTTICSISMMTSPEPRQHHRPIRSEDRHELRYHARRIVKTIHHHLVIPQPCPPDAATLAIAHALVNNAFSCWPRLHLPHPLRRLCCSLYRVDNELLVWR